MTTIVRVLEVVASLYRAQLFGWVSRQQFEETWMALLSVLGSPDPHQEQGYTNQVLRR